MTPVRGTLGMLLVALYVGLPGCATFEVESYRQGRELAAEGKIEESLERFQQAIREQPSNAEYRAAYHTTRERAITGWGVFAEQARSTGQIAEAATLYRRVLAIDPNNARAQVGLDDIARDQRHGVLFQQARLAFEKGDADSAMTRVKEILAQNPRHRAAAELRRAIEAKTVKASSFPKLDDALRKPITIEFRDTPLRQVMEVFSRTSGINFVFDRDVRPDLRTTVFLRNTTVRDAMAMVLLTNQLEYRILDATSVVVYPNTPAKVRQYQPLTVRTFFLDHGDVKVAATTLRTILKTRDLIVDERQNLIIMRDTPEAVRMAEKLIALHDLPEPEVMLDVEILEIKRTRLFDLGVQWPGQLSLTPLSTTGGTTLTLEDLRNLSSRTLGASINPLVINLRKQDGDVNLLANPRIRSKNREKARILVGERVPNITSTATATGFVSESVTYVDVGLKLEVEPTVSMNDEIAIKIGLEVSSIVQQIQTRSGSLAYQIGTRNANTVLRLRDGENQVLAGLISDEDRSSANRVPGLGDIPVLGRLFGSQRDDSLKTEIVLSITPRIVRNPQRPSLAESEFDAGTEASLRNVGIEGGAVPIKPLLQPKPGLKPAVPAPQPVGPGAASPPRSLTGAAGMAGTDPAAAAGVIGGGVAGPSPIVATGATTLVFQGPARAAAGTSFDLVLAVRPDQPLTSLPFSIGFDPKLIEVVAINEGDFMRQGGASSNFTTKIDAEAGRVFGTATRGGGDGALNPGTLLTLSVRALVPNASTTVQLIAVGPIGVGGRAVTVQPTPPYQLQMSP